MFKETGERNSWGVFGEADQVGTLNLITPSRILDAARLVKKGMVINLSLPLNFELGLFGETGGRSGYKHNMSISRSGRDDVLDNFALQGSSQWDGLRHIRYREFGYYGGRQDEDIDRAGDLGMEHWAQRGIIGRGVLIDAVSFFEEKGQPISPEARVCIGGSEIESIANWAAIGLQPGDIILLRTGWLRWLKSLELSERQQLRARLHPNEGGMDMPGLDPSQATAAWLWNHEIAAIAADNFTVEALRVRPQDGYQHRRLIALQGMPIGELWDLEELSAACAADRCYEFMLVSAPLYIPGGVGSPANAYAIK